MSFDTASTSIAPIFLAAVTAGKTYPYWTPSGANFEVAETNEVTAVRYNGTSLTVKGSVGALTNNSYCHVANVLTIKLTSGTPNSYANICQAELTFRFGNTPSYYSSKFYDNRIKSLPNLSYRIEQKFQGIAQIGGGTLVVNNGDGFFDALESLQWDAGKCTIYLGDTIGTMQTIGSFLINGWNKSNTEFEFQLKEIKGRLENKIPLTFFDKTAYPNLDDSDEGKPIPIAYGQIFGAQPICVDTSAGQFKLASHAISSVDAVRIVTNDSWEDVSPTVDLANATVTLNALGDIRATYGINSSSNYSVVFDVIPTAGSFPDITSTGQFKLLWYNVTDYSADPESDPYLEWLTVTNTELRPFNVGGWWGVYIVPMVRLTCRRPSPTTFTSVAGKSYAVKYKVWDGEQVSVDFHGKTKVDGYWMNNPADIVEDLLSTYFGETALASFSTAEAFYQEGYIENDSLNKSCIRTPSIYLNELTDGLSVINKINDVAASYLYISPAGNYEYKAFSPARGKDCKIFTDEMDFLTFKTTREQGTQPGKLIGNYGFRISEDWSQTTSFTNTEAGYRLNSPITKVDTYDLILPTTTEADYYLQRIAEQDERPIYTIQCSTVWRGFDLEPGDQIRFQSTRHAMDGLFEIMEVTYDLNNGTVNLVLSNRHGFDLCGFWVDHEDTLPASLGGGTLVWDHTWDADAKNWAKQNVGYWTDAFGYAHADDGDSFKTSRWF